MSDITIYKPRKSVIGGGLLVLVIIFFGLTLPLIIEDAIIPTQKAVALAGFWLMGIALTIAPLGFKLEVGNGYIKTYFLNFCLRNLQKKNIEVIEYGNLLRGGLGAGKGLKIWERTPKGNRHFSIGENVYGKEAIAHAKRVLE